MLCWSTVFKISRCITIWQIKIKSSNKSHLPRKKNWGSIFNENHHISIFVLKHPPVYIIKIIYLLWYLKGPQLQGLEIKIKLILCNYFFQLIRDFIPTEVIIAHCFAMPWKTNEKILHSMTEVSLSLFGTMLNPQPAPPPNLTLPQTPKVIKTHLSQNNL